MSLIYAPNISWLLPELPVGERPGALSQAGFSAIEFGFPSAVDLDALERARAEYGLEIVLFNQDVPVWDRQNRGYLCDPDRQAEFHQRLEQALLLAERLSVQKVMLPAGVELPEIGRQRQHDLVVENLLYAAPLAALSKVLLTIEVLNPLDNPGYFLTSSQEAVEIVRQVDHPSVRFQFDTYHLQALEGGLPEAIRKYGPWIGHVQFADHPGRGRPGSAVCRPPGPGPARQREHRFRRHPGSPGRRRVQRSHWVGVHAAGAGPAVAGLGAAGNARLATRRRRHLA